MSPISGRESSRLHSGKAYCIHERDTSRTVIAIIRLSPDPSHDDGRRVVLARFHNKNCRDGRMDLLDDVAPYIGKALPSLVREGKRRSNPSTR